MKNLLTVSQIVTAILLIAAILLQPRGQGLGSSFGGGGEFYHSKRGLEKLLFWATICLITVFLITSVLNLIL